MTDTDKQQFAELILAIAEMFPGKPPSNEKIQLFFMALKDLSLEEIRNNAAAHVRNENFFPTVHQLRNEPDPEIEAQEAFILVEDALNKYYDPYFHSCTLGIIRGKLGDRLFKLVQRFGTEMYYQENITATRAQFLKAYKAEKKGEEIKALKRGGEVKQIGAIVKQIEESHLRGIRGGLKKE